MLLPESMLRTISYYESIPHHRTLDDYGNGEYHDSVTIHFKSSFKRKKHFKWQSVRTTKGDQTYIEASEEFNELKKQLDEYFSSIKKAEELRL